MRGASAADSSDVACMTDWTAATRCGNSAGFSADVALIAMIDDVIVAAATAAITTTTTTTTTTTPPRHNSRPAARHQRHRRQHRVVVTCIAPRQRRARGLRGLGRCAVNASTPRIFHM